MGQLARRDKVDKVACDILGGGLRPADPRRFLVEAMVAAIHADGVVDPRELAVLKRTLAGHALFTSVAPTVADTMIELAVDAVAFAGDPRARIPSIARGLPSRIYRVTAYAMACEIVAADGEIAAAEIAFLDLLRQHLRVSAPEGVAILSAISEHRLGEHLDARIAWIRGLMPVAAELFGLRAQARGTVDDAHLEAVRAHFLSLPDLRGEPGEIDGQLRAELRKPPVDVQEELRRIAASVPDVVDRWWLAVYVLAADATDLRHGGFDALLLHHLGFGQRDVVLVAADAEILRRAPNLRSPADAARAGEQDLPS